jgi:DNA-binding PadR family transcriptional regulator
MARRRNISPQTKVLIAALLEAPTEWRHGYELSKLTALKSGTLYPLLMRLSDQGLLESKWEPPAQAGRPPRHVYRLTLAGATLAREQSTPSLDDRLAGPIGGLA